MKQLSDLLTQTATVMVYQQTFTASGKESVALTAVPTLSEVPCLVVPMGAEQATWRGLNVAQRPVEILFEPDKLVTEDENGQAYALVQITVDNAVTYTAVQPQQTFGENLGCDDVRHISVAAVRREDAGV